MSPTRLLLALVVLALLGGGWCGNAQAQPLPGPPPPGSISLPPPGGSPPGKEASSLTPPLILFSSPADGATDVDPEVISRDGIRIWFSAPIDTTRMVVHLEGNGQEISWSAWLREDSTMVVSRGGAWNPPLGYATTYHLTLSGIRDRAGNVAARFLLTFTTAREPAPSLPDSLMTAPGSPLISTVAGNGSHGNQGDGGPATLASLGEPRNIFIDTAGDLYIADLGRVRKVGRSTGIISTVYLADSEVQDLTVDYRGSLYVADGSKIVKIDSSGTVSTLVGTSFSGYDGDGNPAIRTSLYPPSAILLDPFGVLYIADYLRLRRVDPITTLVSTIAEIGFTPDMSSAHAGYVLTVDWGSSRIHKIDSSGRDLTIAGNGSMGFSGDGGLAVDAQLDNPYGVCEDSAGDLFIADTFNNRIRKVAAGTGLITTVAGDGPEGSLPEMGRRFSGDGGPATAARISLPRAPFVDGNGDLYFADNGNLRIRKISGIAAPTRTIVGEFPARFRPSLADTLPPVVVSTTPADGVSGVSPEEANAGGISVLFSEPVDTALIRVEVKSPFQSLSWQSAWQDLSRTLLRLTPLPGAELDYETAYQVRVSQIADTLGNAADSFTLSFTTADAPVRPDVIAPGTLYAAIGRGTPGFYGDGKSASRAQLNLPIGVFAAPDGKVYVADMRNHRIRMVDTQGRITTVAGNGNSGFTGDGGIATRASLFFPSDVCADNSGNLYIADTENQRIRKVDPQGVISTVAGNGTYGSSGDNGPAIQAQLHPGKLFVDGNGNLLVQDFRRVRQIDSSGTIRTVFPLENSLADLYIRSPVDFFLDSRRFLYIAERESVWKVAPNGDIVLIASVSAHQPAPTHANPAQIAINLNGVFADGDGGVYIAGTSDDAAGSPGLSQILYIDAAGSITTIASRSSPEVLFRDLSIDPAGNIYTVDLRNSQVWRVEKGAISLLPRDTLPASSQDTVAVLPDTTTSLSPGPITLDFDLAEGDQGKVLFEGAYPGRIVDLELYARDLPEISGWSAVLEYDPDQLHFVPGSFRPSPFLPGMVALSDAKAGQVEVGGTVLGASVKRAGSGSLGVVSLEVLPGFGAETTLTLIQVKLRRADGQVVRNEVHVAVRFATGTQVTSPPTISLDFDLSPGNQDLRLAAQAESVYTFQLHIAGAPALTGWNATLEYDPRQVRYLGGSFQPGDFLPGLTPLVDDQEGRLSVGGALLGAQTGKGGAGQLGQLAFETRDDFAGSAVLKVVEFTLRLASGERYRGALRTAATIYHAPSKLVLDLDLADGDQHLRSLSGVVAGKTYPVQLFLHRTLPIRGWGAALRYDAERLRYVSGSFRASDFVPGLVSLVDEKVGEVSVGGSTLGTDGSGAGDGSLGTLEFEVLPGFSGTASVEVTELTLRPLEGGVHKRALSNAISLVGTPPPSLTFDFNPAEGNQEEGSQEKVEAGHVYIVQLLIRDAPAISGWSAAIGYDSEQLRYVEDSFRPGDFIPGLVSLVSPKRDSVIVGGAVLGSSAQNAGQGTLGQLAFEILPGFTGIAWLFVPGFSLRLADGTIRREPAPAEAFFISGNGGATAVASEAAALPTSTDLLPGYPNPFNTTTLLPYQLADAGPVHLQVFTLTGQQIRVLVNAYQPPGYYQVPWQGTDDQGRPLASGVYLVRLQAGGVAQLQKLLLLR